MRYKFRGKRLDGQGWVYGALWVGANYSFVTPENLGIGFDESTHFLEAYAFEVIPESVGQWTGLVDKNGVEIFEGDIVTTDITRPYLIVEFRNGCFVFNCNDGGWDYYDIMLPITENPHDTYKFGEIIGNIHDKICTYKDSGCGSCEVPSESKACNPELMEVE